MEYVLLKWVHILSATILFGAGVGSAFHLFAASLRRRVGGVASSARNVVLADWMLTTPSAILQPVTGVALVHKLGLSFATPWVAWSMGLYAVAIACWLPVVVMQIRMQKLAEAAELRGASLPAAYDRLFHRWTALGIAAFLAFVLIFWLMVAKNLPWSA
ncbi:DUF2269 domain-containing protein [Ramlibacter ginsenosidimutans]|uniref:DUF2269 domain-containing protein n=1 Tax=Ramlibacter ginsenosidimutans TaxID=502333 RepID=A0A934TX42_9BURK|nr:DUF2269 domain-containing protein [Ramlibacter ginsenosidimutans]MBK6008891.1 DUF2269 domain-containing protein [Ramlibacter ginsenosidimutans]